MMPLCFFYFLDLNRIQNKYCMLQYYFDGPEIKVPIKPHGNSKDNAPFFRISETARNLHKELSSKNKPKETVFLATEKEGGEVGARGMCSLPRNRQQIANIRREHHKKDTNVLYSVMLSCKLAQGTQDAFVRDVKAAPDPQSILFYDWQICDMERFLTHKSHFGILTSDPTYNLGQFYVTPITYPHLMLQDINSKKHPSILGPILVHQRMDFATFNYFASTLIGFNKKLVDICAFGTDGQESLIEAFSRNFPSSLQLRCFIHCKKNITEKLKEYGVSSHVAEEFISDIFGKSVGSVYYEGLVDSVSDEDFDSRLGRCKDVWNARESAWTKSSAPKFFDYFSRYKSKAICFSMRKDIREKAGLGSPPSIFTTNTSESINAVLKQKLNFKESEWPEFNDKMKTLSTQQREEVIRALSGRGQYRLLPEYSRFSVSTLDWTKMRPEQRRDVIAKFDRATLRSTTVSLAGQGDTVKEKRLSVSAEDSGITAVTLQHMWAKAERLLSTTNAITPSPGNDTTARMVLSSSSPVPHLVKRGSGGQYVCDSKCMSWTSSAICSHSLAVAEVNGSLLTFLSWFNSSTVQPNITTLAMTGLPTGRGRKGGVPRRSKSHAAVTREVSTPRPVFLQTLGHGASNPGQGLSQVAISPPTSSQQQHGVSDGGGQCGRPAGSQSVNLEARPFQATPVPLNACNVSASHHVFVTQHGRAPVTSPTMQLSVTPQPNNNPFYVKFIQGNVRMCQGCKSTLRLADSTVPPPPFDLAIGRSERRQFRDKNGTLITPRQEQTCHYHLRLDCVISAEPTFVPKSLRIPQDILPLLTIVHREYLRLVFQLTF
jgi:hypothetical protein